MTSEKPLTTVGMSLRRGGARLRAMSKAHSPLHVLLWQARETERALLVSATAQKTLFVDVAAWASSENLAISDVCSNFTELSTLAAAAQTQLAQAFKSFRKDMAMILEAEKRADMARRKLQEAEAKRHKARRLVLQAQNRTQVTGMPLQVSADYPNLQTHLAEAERNAERIHMASCEAKSESEAVKLVILRSTLSKLSKSQMTFAQQLQTISHGGHQLVQEIPDPPPPGDLLSCIRYTGFESTRAILGNIKSQVQILSTSPNSSISSSAGMPPFMSTPLTSPRTTTSGSPASLGNWTTPSPSAPENPFLTSDSDPPPSYTNSINGSSPNFQNGPWTQPGPGNSSHRRFSSIHNTSIVQEHGNSRHDFISPGQRSTIPQRQDVGGDHVRNGGSY